jgi:transcriptional regulator with XRE-family HTH domain
LKRERERVGISQQELAERAGCALQTVSKLERGVQEPAWPLVLALANALDVGVEVFVQCAEQPTEEPRPPGRPRKPTESTAEKPKRTRRKGKE